MSLYITKHWFEDTLKNELVVTISDVGVGIHTKEITQELSNFIRLDDGDVKKLATILNTYTEQLSKFNKEKTNVQN